MGQESVTWAVCPYENSDKELKTFDDILDARDFCTAPDTPKIPLVIWMETRDNEGAFKASAFERWWDGISIETEQERARLRNRGKA